MIEIVYDLCRNEPFDPWLGGVANQVERTAESSHGVRRHRTVGGVDMVTRAVSVPPTRSRRDHGIEGSQMRRGKGNIFVYLS